LAAPRIVRSANCEVTAERGTSAIRAMGMISQAFPHERRLVELCRRAANGAPGGLSAAEQGELSQQLLRLSSMPHDPEAMFCMALASQALNLPMLETQRWLRHAAALGHPRAGWAWSKFHRSIADALWDEDNRWGALEVAQLALHASCESSSVAREVASWQKLYRGTGLARIPSRL